ncbi:MAG: FAD-dependent oxidoreductase [Anaerolineae bacterium]|nr:FAD-dependent oxidoreductase [Anaerolineae bacterium]
MSERVYDVAIIGGSTGGTAAYLAACALGVDAILVSETERLGGQFTVQGVSAFDEHEYIETFGGTANYRRLRQIIRAIYQREYGAPALMRHSVLGEDVPLNPGNGWVSRLCFLPEVGVMALDQLIAETPYTLPVMRCWRPVSVQRSNGHIQGVLVENGHGEQRTIQARYYLDATDAGDLIALAELPHVTGAESRAETSESGAPEVAKPHEVQGFTYSFVVEFCAGEDHTIPKPEGYEYFRDHQPYTLAPLGRDGKPTVYCMFTSNGDNLPFWTYRRIHDGALLGGNDLALINWVSNDYHSGDILNADAAARRCYLDEAKRLSLGFLYWLQTECPRDDGGKGYPELKLRPDVMGTVDGLSELPYLREARRILPLRRVLAQDIAAEANKGARARHFWDSVGIGWYAMDLHPCVGNPKASLYAPTRPFQVPLGALIPQQPTNLLAACKNIGTTHLTNGAYRTHPTEWAIGEAALHTAAFCLRNHLTPHMLYADSWQVLRLQHQLVRYGVPVAWAVDVPLEHPHFHSTQLLLVNDVIAPDSLRWHSLHIAPDMPLGESISLPHVCALAEQLNAHGAALDISALKANLTWSALCNLFDSAWHVLA